LRLSGGKLKDLRETGDLRPETDVPLRRQAQLAQLGVDACQG